MASTGSPCSSDERSASPWTSLHSSILLNIYDHASIFTKFSLMETCKNFRHAAQAPSLWQSLGGTDDEHHLSLWCVMSCMAQSWKVGSGGLHNLNLIARKRSRSSNGLPSVQQQQQQQQQQQGSVLHPCSSLTSSAPFTRGLRCWSLVSLLPNLQHLALEESCCLGGLTDDFCTALGRTCLQLTTLDVKFERYSIPSELFTNAGLIELTEKCTALTHLSLRNTNITDRALYAVAANCKRLSSLRLGGYHECISDGGMAVLVAACSPTLTHLQLSSKLTRVTDVTVLALVNAMELQASRGVTCPLTFLKLTAATTDAGLQHITCAFKSAAGHDSDPQRAIPRSALSSLNSHHTALSGGSGTARLSGCGTSGYVSDGLHASAVLVGQGLQHLDIAKCSLVSSRAVRDLLLCCPALLNCKLPAHLLRKEAPPRLGWVMCECTPGWHGRLLTESQDDLLSTLTAA